MRYIQHCRICRRRASEQEVGIPPAHAPSRGCQTVLGERVSEIANRRRKKRRGGHRGVAAHANVGSCRRSERCGPARRKDGCAIGIGGKVSRARPALRRVINRKPEASNTARSDNSFAAACSHPSRHPTAAVRVTLATSQLPGISARLV